MKIEFHIKDIVMTSRDKALVEKKLMKLKKYCNKKDPIIIDVYLCDETSVEKGGVDQSVELSTVYNGEKIFVKEVDDRLMRAFAFALKSFGRQMERHHRRFIDKSHEGTERTLQRFLKSIRLRRES